MSDKKKTLVALAKEPTVQESVTKVFDLMGGVTNMIKPGTTVMLTTLASSVSLTFWIFLWRSLGVL